MKKSTAVTVVDALDALRTQRTPKDPRRGLDLVLERRPRTGQDVLERLERREGTTMARLLAHFADQLGQALAATLGHDYENYWRPQMGQLLAAEPSGTDVSAVQTALALMVADGDPEAQELVLSAAGTKDLVPAQVGMVLAILAHLDEVVEKDHPDRRVDARATLLAML